MKRAGRTLLTILEAALLALTICAVAKLAAEASAKPHKQMIIVAAR